MTSLWQVYTTTIRKLFFVLQDQPFYSNIADRSFFSDQRRPLKRRLAVERSLSGVIFSPSKLSPSLPSFSFSIDWTSMEGRKDGCLFPQECHSSPNKGFISLNFGHDTIIRPMLLKKTICQRDTPDRVLYRGMPQASD